MNAIRVAGRSALLVAAVLEFAPPTAAQPAPTAPTPPATPRAAAPLDVTGQWVAIVNED